jgi:hypothetical protein
MARAPFAIGGMEVAPGERRLVSLGLSALSNRTPMALPVSVTHGKRDGPTLFVSAAIHGDEHNGVAICRRLLATNALTVARGTLLVVPIVNAFGFIGHSRYLPDRRDLNRSFPGSARGSLAAQLAYTFMNEVVARSDYGIDLHSAAIHRSNLPQIRIDAGHPASLALAEAFGAPIIVHSPHRDGSLRKVANERGVPVIVYEGGEGLRADDFSVSVGLHGILRVLAHLKMIAARRGGRAAPTAVSPSSRWVRAEESGLFRAFKDIGDRVEAGERIGEIGDPYGGSEIEVRASLGGIIIGRTNIPAINQGDALFHIARVEEPGRIQESYGTLEKRLGEDRLLDEDEIF